MKSLVVRLGVAQEGSSSTRRTWIEIRAFFIFSYLLLSSSTRRTWIEIRRCSRAAHPVQGRPPHGGRGLKSALDVLHRLGKMSSSTRRTWIEILACPMQAVRRCGRPPHGGRGLKYRPNGFVQNRLVSSSCKAHASKQLILSPPLINAGTLRSHSIEDL